MVSLLFVFVCFVVFEKVICLAKKLARLCALCYVFFSVLCVLLGVCYVVVFGCLMYCVCLFVCCVCVCVLFVCVWFNAFFCYCLFLHGWMLV